MSFRSLALASLLTVLVVPGCATDRPAEELETASKLNDVSLSFRAKSHEFFVVGEVPICPKDPEVEITGVSPMGGRLDITGFAARTNPIAAGGGMLGFVRGTLQDYGLSSEGPVPLNEVCDDEGENFYEMLIEVKAGSKDSNVTGYRISYTSADGDGHLDIHYPIHVCVDMSTEPCASTTF